MLLVKSNEPTLPPDNHRPMESCPLDVRLTVTVQGSTGGTHAIHDEILSRIKLTVPFGFLESGLDDLAHPLVAKCSGGFWISCQSRDKPSFLQAEPGQNPTQIATSENRYAFAHGLNIFSIPLTESSLPALKRFCLEPTRLRR